MPPSLPSMENGHSGARPPRPRVAAVARTRRAPRFRIRRTAPCRRCRHAVGEVLGLTVPRHQCRLCRLPRGIAASQPSGTRFRSSRTISTDKTQAVRSFLLQHPHVRLHFTPTYSSWLNQSNSGFEDRARSPGAASLRPSPTWLVDPSIHPSLQQGPETDPLAYRNPAHLLPWFHRHQRNQTASQTSDQLDPVHGD